MKTFLNWTVLTLCFGLICATGAFAQTGPTIAPQFDLLGYLEEATLSGADVLAGGTLRVNGHLVIVPRNTIVTMPATFLTWEELFSQSPAPYTGAQTGLALADIPAPLTTYEVHVVGNRVGDNYIAGLITISQQALNSGQGYINFIDYANGEMRIGGVIGDPTTGARVRINDPLGKFALQQTPDARFTIDEENPTIRTETGFPMCLPRSDPLGQTPDTSCPMSNRPILSAGPPTVYATVIDFPVPGAPGATLDATKGMPFVVGDFVTFAGALVQDLPGIPTASPLASPDAAYISAHTIIANIGAYTAPGSDPAYVAIDVTLLGTGGLTIAGATEASTRTRFEGFSTDPSRNVHLFGIDVNCSTGAESDRDWGSIDVDQGAAGGGAVRGRWRFRPSNNKGFLTQPGASAVCPGGGCFLPATREVRAVITTGIPPADVLATPTAGANGIIGGSYRAPISEFIFPENVTGAPIPSNNFDTFPFLVDGSGPLNGSGPVVGMLTPWPGLPLPATTCGQAVANLAPVAIPGSPQSLVSGAAVTLDGGASFDTNVPPLTPLTYAWTQTGFGGLPAVTLTTAAANPVATFTAPTVNAPTLLTFQLVVTNSNGVPSSAATVNVTVNPTGTAILAPIAVATASPVPAQAGTTITLSGAGSLDPNGLLLSGFQWVQTGTGGLPAVTLNGATTPAATFTAPVLPAGSGPRVLTFSLTVTNTTGVSSAPDTATVIVNPPSDTLTITSAVYLRRRQRLTVTATSSVVTGGSSLTLSSATGATIAPSVMTDLGGGRFTLTLNGVGQPSTITITSSLGGSVTGPLTRVR